VIYLDYHQVPLLSSDALGVIAGPLLAGVLIGWLVPGVNPWRKAIIFGALTLVFFDLTKLPGILRFRYILPVALLAVWVFRAHYAKLTTIILATMLAALVLPHRTLKAREWSADRENPNRPANGLVPIVHVIFDEHAAPKAFPPDIPEAAQARDRVRAFYQRHGFRLFENAYSQYFWTQNAVPAVLNQTDSARPARNAELRNGLVSVIRSSVFDWAYRGGYRIRVTQSDYLDICSGLRERITSCRSYPAVSLESLRRTDLDFPRRLLLEYTHLISTQSRLVRGLVANLQRRAWDRASPDDPGTSLPYWALTEPHVTTARRELGTLRRAIQHNLDGSLIFAHIVFPHSPYEVDGDCRPYPGPAAYLRRWSGRGRSNTPVARRLRWSLYARQVECLYSELESLVAAIEAAAPPQGVLVVFQGDHGSRIVEHHPRRIPGKPPTDQDLLDGFATLLAVRGPEIPAGSDDRPVSVQAVVPRLLTQVVSIDSLPSAPVPSVYLDGPGARPRAEAYSAAVLGRFKPPR